MLREAQERETDKRMEALLLESLDDPRPDIEITPEFRLDLKERFRKRVEQRTLRSARK